MTIELNGRHERMIRERIGNGEFPSPDAVVEAALDQLFDPHAGISVERLNVLIDEGVRDLDEGRVHTAEEVDAHMAEHRAAFLARQVER